MKHNVENYLLRLIIIGKIREPTKMTCCSSEKVEAPTLPSLKIYVSNLF